MLWPLIPRPCASIWSPKVNVWCIWKAKKEESPTLSSRKTAPSWSQEGEKTANCSFGTWGVQVNKHVNKMLINEFLLKANCMRPWNGLLTTINAFTLTWLSQISLLPVPPMEVSDFGAWRKIWSIVKEEKIQLWSQVGSTTVYMEIASMESLFTLPSTF